MNFLFVWGKIFPRCIEPNFELILKSKDKIFELDPNDIEEYDSYFLFFDT